MLKMKKIRTLKKSHLIITLIKMSLKSLCFGLLLPLIMVSEGAVLSGFTYVGSGSDNKNETKYEKSKEYTVDQIILMSIFLILIGIMSVVCVLAQ